MQIPLDIRNWGAAEARHETREHGLRYRMELYDDNVPGNAADACRWADVRARSTNVFRTLICYSLAMVLQCVLRRFSTAFYEVGFTLRRGRTAPVCGVLNARGRYSDLLIL